jgi:hypothetical protein
VPRCARHEGFSLHADVAVPARRRDRLEHLVRYVLRTPLALARLTESAGGQLLSLASAEAYRVLKPGGRFAVSDVVVRGEVPAAIRRIVELWIGCVAGALEESQYHAKLAKAGFEVTSTWSRRGFTRRRARGTFSPAPDSVPRRSPPSMASS